MTGYKPSSFFACLLDRDGLQTLKNQGVATSVGCLRDRQFLFSFFLFYSLCGLVHYYVFLCKLVSRRSIVCC